MITAEKEHHLVVGFIDRRKCACGHWLITPAHASDSTVQRVVQAHNRLERHTDWAKGMGYFDREDQA